MTRLSERKHRGTLPAVLVTRSLAFAVVALVACGADRNPDGLSLADATRRQCASVTSELALAADEYRQATTHRYGRTSQERGPVSIQISGRLLACLGARRGEQAALDEISRGIAIQTQRFSEAVAPAEAAQALDALVALGKASDALPLRD